jgi:hypothetical protein
VLELALATDARDVTLVALWDGRPQGDGGFGTAHLVRLARESGRVDVRVIPTDRLGGAPAGDAPADAPADSAADAPSDAPAPTAPAVRAPDGAYRARRRRVPAPAPADPPRPGALP